MNTNTKGRVAVIGGGMAGTAAAWRIKTLGFEPVIYESRDRIGGRMWSFRKNDFIMDAGMSAYLGTYREAISLIHEVGLSDQLSELPAIGGFRRQGRNYHIDYTKPVSQGIPSGYLKPLEKVRALRLGLDTFRHRKSLGYSDYTSLAAIDDETVNAYCRRVLDENLMNYVGRPLVSGTWAADDKDTSVALLFWTVRNMLAPYVYNLSEGVAMLPAEIAAQVETRYRTEVQNVEAKGNRVNVTTAAGSEDFDGCVIATTAEPALAIYPQMDAATHRLYSTNRYRKLGNICIGLSRRPADPCTYYLPTPHEDPDTVAVIADHNKTTGRAPDGKGLLTVLLSHEFLERSENRSDEDLLDYALDRAGAYLSPIRGGEVEAWNVTRWPHSVPSIYTGRFRMIAEYTAQVDRTARVQFASDMDRIPGCNGALVSGEEAARRLAGALGA
ncbi:NAD(P)/FAD-dependent oxidoreductase [Novosphingobium sp. 9U]|uniref:protoporphyrinogen/coproporphyrinogen oxidase n=1 Tax=Novosphingobium sp. 9U TaxID=2653158 RepID=UPI0012F09BFB|nr:FAD-dependent oxidoreductase [Novosphingobium sp. 9U]VWX50144.1 Oxygen-dependent protoporphyrinogen oxidase [Novosphingobium sp. 9U]